MTDYLPLPGTPVNELDTPCIVVDLDIAEANITKLQAAANEMGVPVRRVKIMAFACSSVLAASAGIIQMSRLNSVDALRGTAIELEAVLAVVVGGALLTGGRGSIIGAALGVIMVSMIKQGLILMGIPAFWFKAGIGVVLILAAYINHRVQQASLK